MSRTPEQQARRKKRLTKRNGDRQYFAAVRKLRRRKIDEWQMANHPKRFRRRVVQLAAQAERRQLKQERRDLLKTMPPGTRVKPNATRAIGVVERHTKDPEFPVEVVFKSGLIDAFDPKSLKVVV